MKLAVCDLCADTFRVTVIGLDRAVVTIFLGAPGGPCFSHVLHVIYVVCCSKIAEAEAGVSVNEKKWLVMHVHVQLRLDELRGPQTLGSL
jgi:hypothetical protein